MFNLNEWRKVRRLEERVWNAATTVVATSSVDADVITGVTGRQTAVVPNGVDIEQFASANPTRRANNVVFTGAMRHFPNADAAVWYATEIHPLVVDAIPDATLSIVGADPPATVLQLGSTSINVTGRVERVEPFLQDAAVAIVPLRSGSGTRLKILEAFAARTPVVSTTLGAEGLDAIDGLHLLLRDSPRQFADAVISLLRGDHPASQLVDAAHELANQQYDWQSAVIPRLVAVHNDTIERFRKSHQRQSNA
jgi:glycosyltransferase involved in cell wall biosynthesis